MGTFLTVAAALGYGVLSALVPIFNAELYIGVVAAATTAPVAWMCTVALSLGTVGGKVLIFEASRRGSSRYRVGSVSEEKPAPRTGFGRWTRRTSAQLLTWLRHPHRGPLTVLAASIFGIPPLFVVAVLAGVSKQNVYLFAVAVFVGRFLRFAVITWPVAAIAF